MTMFSPEWWEEASYVITVFWLPLATIAYFWDQSRERRNEEEELFQYLSEEYAEFQKLLLKNADLGLSFGSEQVTQNLSTEQTERRRILYDILISLFERAYMLVYEDKMDKQTARMWGSWEDYIRHWCRRIDFRQALPELLQGEDPDFASYMMAIAAQEQR